MWFFKGDSIFIFENFDFFNPEALTLQTVSAAGGWLVLFPHLEASFSFLSGPSSAQESQSRLGKRWAGAHTPNDAPPLSSPPTPSFPMLAPAPPSIDVVSSWMLQGARARLFLQEEVASLCTMASVGALRLIVS